MRRARAWIDGVVQTRAAKLPVWGTVIVNLTGSFAVRLVVGFGAQGLPQAWQVIAAVGFLGGYTTFATAAVHTAQMVLNKQWFTAAGYAGDWPLARRYAPGWVWL